MNKKAFTLVEVMVSLSIFSMLFLFLLTIEMSNIKIKKYNEATRIYLNFYDALKNDLLMNSTYSTLKNHSSKTVYLEQDKMNLEFLKNNSLNISETFTDEMPQSSSYIELQVSDMSPVLKLTLKMYTLINSKEAVSICEFYKGDY